MDAIGNGIPLPRRLYAYTVHIFIQTQKALKKNARENPGSAKNTTNSSGKALATPKARKSSSGKAWQPLEREKSSGGAPQGHPEPKRQTPTAVKP